MGFRFKNLEQELQIEFLDMTLLKQAFMHASYRNEHRYGPLADNERLEFLGDAVLELAVSEYLYQKFPNYPEGELTRVRASLVCEPSLVTIAKKLKFDEYLLLGKGEEMSGGRKRPSLLADVFEAFVGALYLDQGFIAVTHFLTAHFFPAFETHANESLIDYKTLLQERLQKNPHVQFRYRIVEERGPAHSREFVSQVLLNGTVQGEGVGKSKKEAEQRAAKQALHALDQIGSQTD